MVLNIAIRYQFILLVLQPLSDVHPNGLNSFSHLKIPKYVSAEGRSILRQVSGDLSLYSNTNDFLLAFDLRTT